MGDTLDSRFEDLFPGIRRYPYKGRDDFVTVINHEFTLPDRREYFLVTNLSKDTFETDFFNNDDNSWKEYFYNLQLLVAKMPLPPHEAAGRFLGQAILTAANTDRRLDGLMILTQGASHVMLDTSAKCPDESFRPIDLVDRAFPTVVIETALTESGQKLEDDATRWVRASNGQVTAITIRLERATENIVLRRWVWANNTAVIRQETTITNGCGNRRGQRSPALITNEPFFILPGAVRARCSG
ncbi:uncharacterized protein N7477_004038 [Penicillium maclennaniae]|uniref:uncharacterized protein n=1 Tax=Penicillium maclennaniae TaxID=1343394 RepID=UPI0025414EF9|nr:uncharacterized protein N7477_004038 [Penicillium maclennaniae]KAJ5678405.1 hypothetical protein N7477_004038 [Penicillium maclennaniae]